MAGSTQRSLSCTCAGSSQGPATDEAQWGLRVIHTLLEIGIQFVLSHHLKDLPQVPDMDFYGAAAILSATVDKDVVEVTRLEVAEWTKHMEDHAIERGGGVLQSLGHNEPLPEHTAGSTESRERNVTLAHQYLVEAIGQVDGAEDGAARHGVQYHVLARNQGLRWDGGVVQLVESVDDVPTTRGLLHAEGRARMWRGALSDMAGLPATFEEFVDGLHLVSRQWPLPYHAVLRAWREVYLVANATIRW
ncbi:unnamed protein product [Phytophthora fragariaefolia]|uniref:Unnamed protein product n=1 Tax=Phytophthora fragariaefolia TaxID=1490495 RepID=A0A9W7D9C7_9STRA|nr:unnamed protein product [Phytophthora fragariaefolia]